MAPDPENVDRLKNALQLVFADPAVDEIANTELQTQSVIQYGPPDVDYVIDFIARLGEAFEFDDIESELKEIEGVQVKTATPRMLYKMKRNTVRPQDRVDAATLRERFDLKDEE